MAKQQKSNPTTPSTASVVREVLRRGPMTTAEIVKSLPQHNRFTVRNALANMRSVGAVRSAGSRAYELAPGIDTEADYNALVRKFREEQSGRAIDPVSAVIRMAW